jgi:hypothetical protein
MFSLSVECCWDICLFFCQTPVNVFSLYCMKCGVQKHKEISKVEKDIVLRCVLMFTLHSRTFYLKLNLSCKLVSKISEYCDVWHFSFFTPLRPCREVQDGGGWCSVREALVVEATGQPLWQSQDLPLLQPPLPSRTTNRSIASTRYTPLAPQEES